MLTKEKDIIRLFKIITLAFLIGLFLLIVGRYTDFAGYVRVDLDHNFNSEIISVESVRSDIKVDLKEGHKLILPYADNHDYQPYRLSHFVKRGDTLIKKRDSDTLIVKRYTSEYIFVIGKSIKMKQPGL